MGVSLEVGCVVAGKYRLEREIGSGGMGVVYAATHIHLEQRVALKFLHIESTNPESIERFWREAKSAAKVHSEHVARVLDIGEMDSRPYIVMEFLDGDDLENIVKTCGPLPVADAIRYVLEACEALAEAHALGMVHRDIKPANLFLAARPDGSNIVKLLDFGISKQGWEQQTANTGGRLTHTSAVIGSPRYMSPEQLRSSRDVDQRSDVWALGVTLFELLGAESPFATGTMPEVCASILKDTPFSLVGLRPEVPIELEHVIHRCLAKKPEGRWKNVAELAMALRPFGAAAATNRSIERVTGVMVRGSIPPPITSKTKTADLENPFGISGNLIPQPPIVPSSPLEFDSGRTDSRKALVPTELAMLRPSEEEIAIPRAATAFHDSGKDMSLEDHYLAQIGDSSSIPVRLVEISKLTTISSLNIDHRAGFLISMMDGSSTVEELLMVSGMSRLETLKLICDLLAHRVIRLGGSHS